MTIRICDPKEGSNVPCQLFYYSRTEAFFGCKNSGEVYLTRFDTVNGIVSGRFCVQLDSIYYTLRAAVGDTLIRVTEGRFDIKLN